MARMSIEIPDVIAEELEEYRRKNLVERDAFVAAALANWFDHGRCGIVAEETEGDTCTTVYVASTCPSCGKRRYYVTLEETREETPEGREYDFACETGACAACGFVRREVVK